MKKINLEELGQELIKYNSIIEENNYLKRENEELLENNRKLRYYDNQKEEIIEHYERICETIKYHYGIEINNYSWEVSCVEEELLKKLLERKT